MNLFSLSILLTTLLQSKDVIANQFNGYLILGYAVMWFVGTLYIISLFARQRNLRQDLQLMERLLKEDDETAA